MGNYYDPLVNYYVGIEIYNDDGFYLDESTFSYGGPVFVDLALEPGNYTVYLRNYYTGQYGYFDWNISSRDQNKMTRINATVMDYKLYVDVFTVDNITISGPKDMYINGSYYESFRFRWYDIYTLGEGVYAVGLYFNASNIEYKYYSSNVTFVIDIKNTVNVNDSFFNTTVIRAQVLDFDGNPMTNAYIHFYVGEELYANATDENGFATYDLNLLPGIYEVKVLNPVSEQSKYVTMEVLEEYDYKKAFINVTRDKYKFTFNVTDFYGNAIDGGYLHVMHSYGSDNVIINNGTGRYIYEDYSGEYADEKVNIIFLFENLNYYSTYEYYTMDVVNTISSNDVISNTKFNVTVYDLDRNPLAGKEVLFTIFDDLTFRIIENVTVVSDGNGVASIDMGEEPFIYRIVTKNLETYQSKFNYWTNKKTVEITPIADYVDESTGVLYVNGHYIVFKFSPENECEVYVNYGYDWDDYFVEDGIIRVYLPESGQHDVSMHYFGDYYILGAFANYTVIVCEMDTPTMTISQDLVVGYSDNAKFTVNLANGSAPISNASVEIRIGDNTYSLLTDNDGNIDLSINLDAGKYDVFVTYRGSPSYVSVNKNTTLTVNKAATSIVSSKVTTVYGTGKNLVVTLKDANGKVLSGKSVSVKLNGVTYNKVTNNNGQISVAVPKNLVPKTYSATIVFAGDGNYLKSTASVKVTVKKATLKLSAKKKTFRSKVKVKKYAVSLKNNNGKAIKKAKLALKIKGKAYKATTNAKGKAVFKIKKLTRKGTYKAVVTYKGNTCYNKVTKKVKIKIK